MGAGVSAGESNDDLVDNLIEGLYIRTLSVEKVFRAVDRGCYFLLDPPVNAYRDVAWKNGNFHISAPCIYSEVMEGLNLAPGLSFLNLGSGTGYLNTMAGLLLGSNGVNHGIELHEDVVEYAVKKVEEFKHHSGALDEFDFCEPKFVQGNCLCVPSGSRVYDRVYCGAGCPPQHLNSIQSFVKIGGVLIVPVNEELLEMKRESETKWTPRVLLPVAFANLVHPTGNAQATVNLLDVEPLSLQELCRSTIRNLLRKNIDIELNTKSGKQKPMKTRSLRSREKNLWQSRQEYFRNIRERNSEDYYDYFLTLRHNEGRQQPPPARDSESSSTNTTHSREGNAESKSSSSDSDDSSSLENKMSSLQEIFMDFMSSPNSESARTSSSSDAQMSSTNDCDNKTESSTMSAKTEAFICPEDAKWLNGEVVSNDTVERMRRAHLNDLENIPIFFVAAFAYLWTQPHPALAGVLFFGFTIIRALHTIVYTLIVLPQPTRALIWLVGFLITGYMAIHSALYAFISLI